MMSPRNGSTDCDTTFIHKVERGILYQTSDQLIIEQPLEIRIGFLDLSGKRQQKSISITMRTPGNDFELASGFLFTEGVIQTMNDISSIQYCGSSAEHTRVRNIV